MSNDHQEEDEYHFIEEPSMGAFEVNEPVPSKPQSNTAEVTPKKNLPLLDVAKILEIVNPFIEKVKQNFILRISLIFIVVLLFSVVIYRCTANPLAEKVNEKMIPIPLKNATKIVSSKPVEVVTVKPKVMSQVPIISNQYTDSSKSQSNLQAQVDALSMQVSNLNGNINNIADNLRTVSNQLSQLAASVGNESRISAGLSEQIKQLHPKKKIEIAHMSKPVHIVQYYLQAVIPGRAWLRSSDGDTFTVSQGTSLAQYGVVRYIDALHGQVLTSSGQVIKFSQDDS